MFHISMLSGLQPELNSRFDFVTRQKLLAWILMWLAWRIQP